MPLDPTYRDRLIQWAVQLALAVLVALLARYGLPIDVPPPPPVTVVVTPGPDGQPVVTTHTPTPP